MNVKFRTGVWLVAGCLLMPGPAFSGVVAQAGVPNLFDGKTISCRNPSKVLGIVRNEGSTVVFQARPTGIHWKFELPAMVYDYDQYFMAPDGSAAVVAISPELAYLVSGNRAPKKITGAILAVDFQRDSVLVATADDKNGAVANTDPEAVSGTRVRVFETDTGKLRGDTWFSDTVPAIMKQFYVRLSGDGQSYYYIHRTGSGGEVPVSRDVASGEKQTVSSRTKVPGSIDDMMLYSSSRGYLLISGKIYATAQAGLVPVYHNDEVGAVHQLVESADSSMQPVVGDGGWGAFDTATGAWIIAGEGSSLHSTDAGLTVEDISVDSRSVKTYDFSGAQPRLIRAITPGGALDGKTLACANAFGFMEYKNGEFKWHRPE